MKMRVKLEDIGPLDAFGYRKDLIGKTGQWIPDTVLSPRDKTGGWWSGGICFDDTLETRYFIQVKVSPVETDDETPQIPPEPPTRHGHPDFYRLCEEEMDLHSRKNWDYAAGGDPLGNFLRVSAILSLYPGLCHSDPAIIATTYMLKQLDACLWMLSNKHEAKVEGQGERWRDISVYAKIISILLKKGR